MGQDIDNWRCQGGKLTIPSISPDNMGPWYTTIKKNQTFSKSLLIFLSSKIIGCNGQCLCLFMSSHSCLLTTMKRQEIFLKFKHITTKTRMIMRVLHCLLILCFSSKPKTYVVRITKKKPPKEERKKETLCVLLQFILR